LRHVEVDAAEDFHGGCAFAQRKPDIARFDYGRACHNPAMA
jgi:hypothetical protein